MQVIEEVRLILKIFVDTFKEKMNLTHLHSKKAKTSHACDTDNKL